MLHSLQSKSSLQLLIARRFLLLYFTLAKNPATFDPGAVAAMAHLPDPWGTPQLGAGPPRDWPLSAQPPQFSLPSLARLFFNGSFAMS